MARAMPVLPPKLLTLVFVLGHGRVLLGMKKRGFGEGNWNGFGGKKELGESLHHNHHLETLDLSNNSVTPKACSVIASALKKNDVLSNLILDGNQPGKVGARAIIAGRPSAKVAHGVASPPLLPGRGSAALLAAPHATPTSSASVRLSWPDASDSCRPTLAVSHAPLHRHDSRAALTCGLRLR